MTSTTESSSVVGEDRRILYASEVHAARAFGRRVGVVGDAGGILREDLADLADLLPRGARPVWRDARGRLAPVRGYAAWARQLVEAGIVERHEVGWRLTGYALSVLADIDRRRGGERS